MCVRGEHLEVILGVALVVLLPGLLSHPWVAGEQDAWAGPVPAGPEGALATGHVTVAIELPGVLAEVPDVSVTVLRVEIIRDLARLAGLSDHVVDWGDAPALDLLAPVGHSLVVVEVAVRVDAAVMPRVAGLERKPRVVDPADEVARAKGLWSSRTGPQLN